MLKTKALLAVEGTAASEITPMSSEGGKSMRVPKHQPGMKLLTGNVQNIVIESIGDETSIPVPVRNLAVEMMRNCELLKDLLYEFRQMYIRGENSFSLSLAKKSDSEKKQIIDLFYKMAGLVSCFYYNPELQTLDGSLAMTKKSQMFMTGQYLEIAIYEMIRSILQELAGKFRQDFAVYRNVRVATPDGKLKNEYDVVFTFGGIIYAVECKSGKKLPGWDTLTKRGKTLGIVPDRLLLVHLSVSDDQAACIEYFCDYYVCNKAAVLREKITKMICNDFCS